MEKTQWYVKKWHQEFGVLVNEKPTIVPLEIVELRRKLIQEEFDELYEAMVNGDLVEIADACADLIYVVNGTAVSYGIDLDPVHDEVQRSNMSKAWPDGTVHYREDGKVLKPPTYSPANIEAIIERQKQ